MFDKNPSPKRKGKHSNTQKTKKLSTYVTKEMDINKVMPKGI